MEFSELGRQRVSETTTVIVGSRDSPIGVLAAAFEKPHARTGPALLAVLALVADVTLPFIACLPQAEHRQVSEHQILQRVDEAAQHGCQETRAALAHRN